jgi:hypothetical protein
MIFDQFTVVECLKQICFSPGGDSITNWNGSPAITLGQSSGESRDIAELGYPAGTTHLLFTPCTASTGTPGTNVTQHVLIQQRCRRAAYEGITPIPNTPDNVYATVGSLLNGPVLVPVFAVAITPTPSYKLLETQFRLILTQVGGIINPYAVFTITALRLTR